jgi:hypothetical protein
MAKWLLLIMMLVPFLSHGAESPQLLGYGVNSCDAYLNAYRGWEEGVDEHIAEYLHYRDWLAGFVSGLSLAAGKDVLRGVELAGAMRRIQLQCDEYRDNDFFNTALTFIRQLSRLEALPEDGEGSRLP